MGKVEDMRRQRELIYEQNQRAAAARAAAAAKAPAPPKAAASEPAAAKAPPAEPASPDAPADELADELADEPAGDEPAAAARPAKKSASKLSRPRAARGGDEQGACSVCGKLRPLQGGMVSSHQKGFGKACPGSRKPPAA